MNYKKAIKIWSASAKVMPITALALLFFTTFIGWEDNIRIMLIVMCTVFFSVSVIWWWWVLGAVGKWMETIQHSTDSLSSIKDEIKEVKKEIERVSNR